MAVGAVITCPACKKRFKGRADLEGKKIRCPACGDPFIVQGAAVDKPGSAPGPARPGGAAPAPARAPAKPPAKRPKGEEEDDPNPYGVTALDLWPRCPHCANPMASQEAIICLHCGYNTQTRQLPEVKKMIAHTGGERFLWLLPGLACALGMFLVVNLDIFFCLLLPPMVQGSWAEFLDHESMRMWTVIPSLSAIWGLGYFAYKRLILHPTPPEKVKD